MTGTLFDPTVSPEEEAVAFAPRPTRLEGLRLGLVDNTKTNADVIIRRIAARLEAQYGIRTTHYDVKVSPAHGVTEEAIAALKARTDFVIAGVGD